MTSLIEQYCLNIIIMNSSLIWSWGLIKFLNSFCNCFFIALHLSQFISQIMKAVLDHAWCHYCLSAISYHVFLCLRDANDIGRWLFNRKGTASSSTVWQVFIHATFNFLARIKTLATSVMPILVINSTSMKVSLERSHITALRLWPW